MVAYEILLMLDPELPEERQEEIVKRARELVERRATLFVHRRAPYLRVEGLGRVDRDLARLELVAVVDRVAGLREPRLQLFRAGVASRLRLRPAALQRAIGGQSPGRARDPGEEAAHGRDATLAAASCLVIAPFRPERRKQSGPIQTMGRPAKRRYRDL